MAYKAKTKKPVHTFLPGMVVIAESVLLGSSGAIATNGQREGAKHTGFTISKTGSETGRYTITFERKYKALLYGHAVVVGADDAAYTATAGVVCILRDDDIATDGTIEVQMLGGDGNLADANPINDATLKLFLVLKDTSVGE